MRVFCLADYFLIANLKEYALKRFTAKVQKLWVSDRFSACVENVFNSTTRNGGESLRRAVVSVAKDHISELLAKQPFEALLYEGGDFGVDLVRMMSSWLVGQ